MRIKLNASHRLIRLQMASNDPIYYDRLEIEEREIFDLVQFLKKERIKSKISLRSLSENCNISVDRLGKIEKFNVDPKMYELLSYKHCLISLESSIRSALLKQKRDYESLTPKDKKLLKKIESI
ncbi:hypothetical protein [Flammeovirga pacifica]|uniref:Uncharacterized protein n=1 Tax=Flammeovirga pacifica TaxID=915059 RepID=A0A1S1YRY6_FLAPC|nr:hypothetical protein [Flammeovirga pacifica]OHX63794.1 hypothetical protein NH26_24825 [Flammeovirga pacifica]